jgi:hypothetical protein
MYGHYTIWQWQTCSHRYRSKGRREWGEKPVRHTENPIDKGRIVFERYLPTFGYGISGQLARVLIRLRGKYTQKARPKYTWSLRTCRGAVPERPVIQATLLLSASLHSDYSHCTSTTCQSFNVSGLLIPTLFTFTASLAIRKIQYITWVDPEKDRNPHSSLVLRINFTLHTIQTTS